MLFKILLLIAIIAGVYYFFIKAKPIENKKSKKAKIDSEDIMVECEKCSTFVSNKEAIIKNGKFYCSKECAGLVDG